MNTEESQQLSHSRTLTDSRTFRVLLTATLFAGGLFVLYSGREVILAIVFALFFSYMLEPVVKFMQPRLRNSRGAAIAVAYAALAIFIGGLILVIGGRANRQLRDLREAIPSLVEKQPADAAKELAERAGAAPGTRNRVQRWIDGHRETIKSIAARVSLYTAPAARVLFWSVVIPILAVWVLKDKGAWLRWLAAIPEKEGDRDRLREALLEIDHALARYMWAMLMIALLEFAAFAIFLSAVGMNYAIVLAAVSGFLALIFVFGPLTSAAVVLLAAAVQGNQHWLAILLFLAGWRVVQDYVNTPILFGRRLELHPLVIIFVLFVGWEIGNVFGMFLAVPIAAAFQIMLTAWHRYGHPARDVIAWAKRDAT